MRRQESTIFVCTFFDLERAGRQGQKVRFLHHVGRLRTHAQDLFRFGVGASVAPETGLGVQIGPVPEGTPGQEIALDVGERSFDPPLSIRMPDGRQARNSNPNKAPNASISGAIKALGPEPAASITEVLSMRQRPQVPSKKRSASVRKVFASKRVRPGNTG